MCLLLAQATHVVPCLPLRDGSARGQSVRWGVQHERWVWAAATLARASGFTRGGGSSGAGCSVCLYNAYSLSFWELVSRSGGSWRAFMIAFWKRATVSAFAMRTGDALAVLYRREGTPADADSELRRSTVGSAGTRQRTRRPPRAAHRPAATRAPRTTRTEGWRSFSGQRRYLLSFIFIRRWTAHFSAPTAAAAPP